MAKLLRCKNKYILQGIKPIMMKILNKINDNKILKPNKYEHILNDYIESLHNNTLLKMINQYKINIYNGKLKEK